jgi:hypothetical protein
LLFDELARSQEAIGDQQVDSIALFLFAFIFTFVLWFALIPGLVMGISIGMLVRSKSKSWKWCLVISGIAATMFIIGARREFSLEIMPIWIALLPWTFLGRWLGRVLLPPDKSRN